MDAVVANPVIKSFLAGSLSGTCSTILFQPLDLVKTRIQQNDNTLLVLNQPGNGSGQAARSGMYSTLRSVVARDTVLGLWRGIVPSVTRTVPGVGLYFGSLHWLKINVASGNEKPNPVQAVGLGITARCLAGSVMIPITVVKTRFESNKYNYSRMTSALADIYGREGVRGLCCGLVPTLVRDAPYSGIYLMFYTQLKQNCVEPVAAPAPLAATIVHFFCGITAGLLASAVTHPADVVKTRMQLDPASYRSIGHAISLVWADSGPRGFLVGLAPRMLRRTLMSALAWTLYEELMRRTGLKK